MPAVRRGRIAAVALALGAAALVAWALAAGLGGGSPRHLVVGGVEDAAKWSDPAGNMARARRAGFRGDRAQLRVDARCRPRRTSPELDRLRTAVDAAAARRDPADRRRLLVRRRHAADAAPAARLRRATRSRSSTRCRSFATSASATSPTRTCSGGRSSAAAATTRPPARYFRLLRTAYPLRQGGRAARDGDRRLAGGARQRQPVRRTARRTPPRASSSTSAASSARADSARPPLDLFSLHPYPANSSIPPTVARPHSTAIGIADYPKLVRLLTRGFGKPPPIVYGEYGIQTQIPRRELGLYSGRRASSIRPVERGAAGRRLRRGDPARLLPAARPDARLLPRDRRVGVHAGSRRGSTTRTSGRRGACAG